MAVELVPVTHSNRDAVAAVRVTEEQRAHLDTQSFADFLDDAPQHPTFEVYAVLEGETIVGFVSYGFEPQDATRWSIPLVVVDAAHQHRGMGRAALRAVIDGVRAHAEAVALGLSFRPANPVAERSYLGLGFDRAGFDDKGEVVAWLPLERQVARPTPAAPRSPRSR